MGKYTNNNNDTLERFKIIQQIQKYYDEYQQTKSVKLPRLNIRFIHSSTSITMRVEHFHGHQQSVQLTVDILGAKTRQLDFKTACFHEFTHILDFFQCELYDSNRHQYYTTLSEIHASYEEMTCRVKLSGDINPTINTCLPVLSGYQTVVEYMDNERADIIAFYNKAVQNNDIDAAARFWKHLQYYCGYYLCLTDNGIEIPIDFDEIPANFYTSIMNCGVEFIKNPNVFTKPTDEILNRYYLAEQSLYGLISGH